MKQAGDGWTLRTILFTAPNGVYGNWMEPSVDAQIMSWLLALQLLLLLRQEVAAPQAEPWGRMQHSSSPIVSPVLALRPLGPASQGWLRELLHGRRRQQSCLGHIHHSPRWVSLRTCLAWSLFSFPSEERRTHGRAVTEQLSWLPWPQPAVPNELLLRFLLWLWRLQPKGQEAVEKELELVCQQCKIHPRWETLNHKREALMGVGLRGMDGSLPAQQLLQRFQLKVPSPRIFLSEQRSYRSQCPASVAPSTPHRGTTDSRWLLKAAVGCMKQGNKEL